MDRTLLELLRSVDTPTVCNAIEVVQGKRGFDAFTRQTVQPSAPDAGAVVGYARTARIRALAPSEEAAEVVKARRMAYYKYMSQGPRPSLAVIQDLDGQEAVGAFWGEINTNVHKALGVSGALTDGLMRDLGDLPEGFPVLAGSVGPSHGFVHVVDFDTPVRIFGLPVTPGALIHADRHGAVVIPDDAVAGMQKAVAKLVASEKIVLDAVRGKTLNFEEFESVWAAFEAART